MLSDTNKKYKVLKKSRKSNPKSYSSHVVQGPEADHILLSIFMYVYKMGLRDSGGGLRGFVKCPWYCQREIRGLREYLKKKKL